MIKTPHSPSCARARSQILATGAEAVLLRQNCTVIKRRVKKSYRIKEIDEKLRKLRTRAESKIMQKLENKINVPKILKVDEKSKEIVMQYIEGKKLSDYLDNFPIKKQIAICQEIGKEVAKIHDLNIIHSDLTTSNMILVDNSINKSVKIKEINKKADKTIEQASEDSLDLININNNQIASSERAKGAHEKGKLKIFFIDFGLSFYSTRIEDKACDLHLLRQALEAKHFKNWEKLFKAVLSGYDSEEKEKILNQLKKVEARGRYK